MIAAGGLILDPTTGHLRRTGCDEFVRLSPMRARLLGLLMCNVGELVTRDAIFEHLYGAKGPPVSSVLGVMIHAVRSAIVRAGGDRNMIQNIFRFGWIMAGDTAQILIPFDLHQRAALDVLLAQSPPHVRSAADLVRAALR